MMRRMEDVRPAISPPPSPPAGRFAVSRDASVDVVRIVGVLAVVAGHLWTSGWVREAVFPWHVPAFFVLTGYLWQRRPWRRELVARASTLLRPYLGCLAVVAIVVLALRDLAPDLVAGESPLALLWGGEALDGPYTAFWFVSCLFAACLLYAAVDPHPRWRAAAVAAAVITGVVGTEWLAGLPLSAGVALPALVFLEFGRQLRQRATALDHPLATVLATLVLAAVAATIAAGTMPTLDLKIGDFGPPLLGTLTALLIVTALLVLARRATHRVGGNGARLLGTIAGSLSPVVLLHPLVLVVAAPAAVRFALAVAAPLAIALVAHRTHFSGWLTGR